MNATHTTLTQLRVLVAAADAGSFTQAAERLHLTQSAVSHAITALEAELGATVFDRRRGGVALSEFGRRIWPHACEILAREEAIRQEASAVQGQALGRLRLGTVPSIGSRLLPGLLADFHRRNPGIDVVALEGTDQEVLDWLAQRTVDVGLVSVPAEGFDTVALGTDELMAVVPARHRLASRPAVRLAQLEQDPFIMSQGGCETTIMAAFQAAQAAPRVQHTVRNLATIVAMVEEGLGVTVLPELAIPARHPRAVVRPLVPRVRRQLLAAVRSLRDLPPALSAFLALCRKARESGGR